MCMSHLSEGVYATVCVPCACEGLKRKSDSQELEFKMVVRCRVGAGNQTPSSARAAGDFSH